MYVILEPSETGIEDNDKTERIRHKRLSKALESLNC
jgi:hypothetical protein